MPDTSWPSKKAGERKRGRLVGSRLWRRDWAPDTEAFFLNQTPKRTKNACTKEGFRKKNPQTTVRGAIVRWKGTSCQKEKAASLGRERRYGVKAKGRESAYT